VEVSDQFGCVSTRSLAQSIERPTQIEFANSDVVRPISCINTQQIRINVSGGTGALTVELLGKDALGNRINPITVVATNNSPGLGIREFELEPGNNFFRAMDLNGCEAFFQMEGNETPAAIEYEITPRQEDRVELCFGETDFVDIDGNVIGGLSGYGYSIHVAVPDASQVGGFRELEAVVDESGTNVNINAILQTARRDGITRYEGLRSLETLIANGTFPSDAIYVYRVTSGDCDQVYRPFEILEQGEIIIEPLDITGPICAGEENASVSVTIANSSDPGEYSITIVRGDGVPLPGIETFDINVRTVGRLLNIADTPGANRTINFNNLSTGNYQLLVTGNNCPLQPMPFTIADKLPLTVTEDVTIRSNNTPSCPEENGSVGYIIEGGTPPYFYAVLDLGPVIPDPSFIPDEVIAPEIEVWGNPARFVPVSTTIPPVFAFTVDRDEDGDLLKNNNRYQIVVVDSGNERFDMAQAASGNFVQDFEADGSTALIVCDEIVNLPVFEVPDLTGFTLNSIFNCDTANYEVTVNLREDSTLIRENITYRLENISEGTIVLGERGNNIFNNVPGGDYVLSLSYLNPTTLQTCDSRNFVIRDGSGTVIDEPGIVRETLEIREPLNILRQTDENGDQTGVPFELIGLNEYRVTAQGGRPPYNYQVINANGDAVTVTQDLRGRATFIIENTDDYIISVTDANGCSTSAEATRIAFIDLVIPNVFNPASDNPEVRRWYPGNTTFGDIENFPDGGVIIENGDIEFVITIGGITTGGVQSGGVVTGGTTTGAITLVTTIRADGTSTVRQITGATITGGTTSGTITGTAGSPTIIGGVTTGGVITGGTSGGEVETGVTTSNGGTTVITTTIGSFTPPGTPGGVTSGGITLETTTRQVGETIVTTVRVVDNADVTGGTNQGGLVTGGTLVPGTGTVTQASVSVPTISDGDQRITPEDEFVDFANIEVMVFDRYGRLLEQFRGILDTSAGEGWDGTYEGNNMPSGDYWYLVKLNDRRGREFTGHFTLYRSK